MRIPWQVNTVAAAACTGVGLADLALHEWWGLPVLATSAGLNVWISHRNYGRQHPPEAPHRPDYAKIRRLELELGLRDPDPPPVTEPVVKVTRTEPPQVCPFGGPPCHGCPHWPNCIEADRWIRIPLGMTMDPPPKIRPRETPKYQLEIPPPVTYPQEWQWCPVCTRRHAGRCAG